jgi:hypothetical protein
MQTNILAGKLRITEAELTEVLNLLGIAVTEGDVSEAYQGGSTEDYLRQMSAAAKGDKMTLLEAVKYVIAEAQAAQAAAQATPQDRFNAGSFFAARTGRNYQEVPKGSIHEIIFNAIASLDPMISEINALQHEYVYRSLQDKLQNGVTDENFSQGGKGVLQNILISQESNRSSLISWETPMIEGQSPCQKQLTGN